MDACGCTFVTLHCRFPARWRRSPQRCWVTARKGLHALMLKNTSVFSYCAVSLSVSLRPSPAWTNKSLHAKQANKHQLCKCVTLWCHEVAAFRAGLLRRRFRSSDFCGREDLPELFYFNFLKMFYMHKNLYKTLKESDEMMKKHNRSP